MKKKWNPVQNKMRRDAAIARQSRRVVEKDAWSVFCAEVQRTGDLGKAGEAVARFSSKKKK